MEPNELNEINKLSDRQLLLLIYENTHPLPDRIDKIHLRVKTIEEMVRNVKIVGGVVSALFVAGLLNITRFVDKVKHGGPWWPH